MRLDVMRIILDRANILDEINNASGSTSTFVPTDVRFPSKKSKEDIMTMAVKLISDNADPAAVRATFTAKSNGARILTDSFKKSEDSFDKTWSFSEMEAAFPGQLYFFDPTAASE